jgi:predicted transcriptional regulator
MMNEPRAMKEIHDIREKIHESTKNMSEKEVTEYYANAAHEIEETYAVRFRRPETVAIPRAAAH